jgi:hypothetical protein
MALLLGIFGLRNLSQKFGVARGTMTNANRHEIENARLNRAARYNTWNRNRFAVGVQQSMRRGPLKKMLLPKRQVILDLYYMRQNDSRSDIPHVNPVNAALAFYF